MDDVVTVTNTQVTVLASVELVTGDIDAQSNDIVTTGTVQGANIEATTFVADTSVKVPLLLSDTDAISLGDDDDFLLTRPQNSGAGAALTIQGQEAAAGGGAGAGDGGGGCGGCGHRLRPDAKHSCKQG